jgi:diadenosine tetraphosphate (Ap4A) HIT family hydrolase
MADADCPFCEKLARLETLPADDLVWQFSRSVVLLGSWQFYHGYCLLVSRRHATELNQLAPDERRAFLDELCVLAAAIEGCFRPDKLNYELLGNQVPHLHWHVFPRSRRDSDFRRPVWLALDRAEREDDEGHRLQNGPLDRATTAAILRAKLAESTALLP